MPDTDFTSQIFKLPKLKVFYANVLHAKLGSKNSSKIAVNYKAQIHWRMTSARCSAKAASCTLGLKRYRFGRYLRYRIKNKTPYEDNSGCRRLFACPALHLQYAGKQRLPYHNSHLGARGLRCTLAR